MAPIIEQSAEGLNSMSEVYKQNEMASLMESEVYQDEAVQ